HYPRCMFTPLCMTPATTVFYTLSLHDALPIYHLGSGPDLADPSPRQGLVGPGAHPPLARPQPNHRRHRGRRDRHDLRGRAAAVVQVTLPWHGSFAGHRPGRLSPRPVRNCFLTPFEKVGASCSARFWVSCLRCSFW